MSDNRERLTDEISTRAESYDEAYPKAQKSQKRWRLGHDQIAMEARN
jgi:hypothetical protein